MGFFDKLSLKKHKHYLTPASQAPIPESRNIKVRDEHILYEGKLHETLSFTGLYLGRVFWQGEHFSNVTFGETVEMFRYDERGRLVPTRYRNEPFSLTEEVVYGYVTFEDGTQHVASLQLTPKLSADFELGTTYKIYSVMRKVAVGRSIQKAGALIMDVTDHDSAVDIDGLEPLETWVAFVKSNDAKFNGNNNDIQELIDEH
jgi:hypothetical protein